MKISTLKKLDKMFKLFQKQLRQKLPDEEFEESATEIHEMAKKTRSEISN